MKAMEQEVNNFYKRNEKLIAKLDADIVRRTERLHKDREKLDQVKLLREKLTGNGIETGKKIVIEHEDVNGKGEYNG